MISVTRYAPDLPAWPSDFSLRVAVLSDFHACHPFMDGAAIRAICAQTNALNPDIVLLLGDYVSGPRFSRPDRASLWTKSMSRTNPTSNLEHPRLAHSKQWHLES